MKTKIDDVLYGTLGEDWFLRTSKVSYQRLGQAVVEYGLTINSVLTFPSSYVIACSIPASNLKEIEDLLKSKFKHNANMRIGFHTRKSIKWMDKNQKKYYSPYPDTSDPYIEAENEK